MDKIAQNFRRTKSAAVANVHAGPDSLTARAQEKPPFFLGRYCVWRWPRRAIWLAAKQFLQLELWRAYAARPTVINVDGHPAYATRIAELKSSGKL
jgi:hypothetical protein